MTNTAIIKYTVTIDEIIQGDTAYFRAVATDSSGLFANIRIRHYLIDGVDYDRELQLANVTEWATMMERGLVFERNVYKTQPVQ